MLNPPLSLLPDDLLNYIVDHVAELRDPFSFPFSNSNLHNLSVTDRAFTRACQDYIFKDLRLGYGSRSKDLLSKRLAKIRNILKDKPSFANRVRKVHLIFIHEQNKWLFNEPNFITIFQLLAKSLMPPHNLQLSGHSSSSKIEDPIFFVGWLMESFFSQSLTILNLTECKNIPLALFLVCPKLREVYLQNVDVLEAREDEYPDTQFSDRELPALEHLNYRNSESLVKRMTTPSPNFSKAVVDWSKLRVLMLYSQDKEGMMSLQPILDAACSTLEELCLTCDNILRVTWGWGNAEQLSFAGLVDLRHLPNLHIFSIQIFIRCDAQEAVVLRDINLILRTIPNANQVTQLSLRFNFYGEHAFRGCLEQDWVGMCDEVVRISARKQLELYLELSVVPPWPGGNGVYEQIKDKIESLSDYPNICTHFWHP